MITVAAEPNRKLVFARMSGFLSIEEVEQFSREEQGAVEKMGLRSGEHLLLIDTGNAVIQAQQVIAAFMHIVVHSRFKARRIAVVRHNSLTYLQSRRILSLRDNAEVFDTPEEAERWLFAEEGAPLHAARDVIRPLSPARATIAAPRSDALSDLPRRA